MDDTKVVPANTDDFMAIAVGRLTQGDSAVVTAFGPGVVAAAMQVESQLIQQGARKFGIYFQLFGVVGRGEHVFDEHIAGGDVMGVSLFLGPDRLKETKRCVGPLAAVLCAQTIPNAPLHLPADAYAVLRTLGQSPAQEGACGSVRALDIPQAPGEGVRKGSTAITKGYERDWICREEGAQGEQITGCRVFVGESRKDVRHS
jgi:hypothetical protein